MLKIFNNLSPFFEDNYRRINVREYARIRKISPPSASKLLESLHKEQLLRRETEKNYIYYSANNTNKVFIELSRVYLYLGLSGFLTSIEKIYISPIVVLFGSAAKAEMKRDSDIDIAIFAASSKSIDTEYYEKRLGHHIQIFHFKTKEDVKNPELLNNILNGFILTGSW